MFSARLVTSVIFSYALQVKLCFSLRVITAYYEGKRYEFRRFPAIFKKLNVNFLAKSHTTSLNKGLSNTSWHLCYVCMLESTHERGNRVCVLRSLDGLGSVASWNRQDCNRQSK